MVDHETAGIPTFLFLRSLKWRLAAAKSKLADEPLLTNIEFEIFIKFANHYSAFHG